MPSESRSQYATSTSLSLTPPAFTERGGGALLVVVAGPDDGQRVVVSDEPIVIGSASDSNLVLTDPTVSRRHLQATWKGSVLELLDLGSKNGCYFGDTRFHRVEVTPGAEFLVGQSLIKVLPDEKVLEPEAKQTESFGSLVGTSQAMRKLFTLIEQVAASDAPVLIHGETGCGKEVVAEELHRRSKRGDKPFCVFDCGAVPSELIESTLFGHMKGAFTGASSDRIGIFAEGDGGTVFLDEIGELKIDLQPALLRVLDRGRIRPVGATNYRDVDTRIVAASHRNLAQMIQDKLFREDLYYRMAVVRLSVPALRERPEDVPILIRHFLRRMGRPDLSMSDRETRKVMEYPWPGNVRELKNAVERAIAFSAGGELKLLDSATAPDPTMHLPPTRLTPALGGNGSAPTVRGDTQAPRYLQPLDGEPLSSRKFRDAKADIVDRFELSYLEDLMSRHDSISAAAEAAGIDRKHLRVLLRRHNLRSD